MNYQVDYEEESICGDVVKTTSEKNTYIQTGGTNAHYISYSESTTTMITPPMASPHDFLGVTHSPGVPGRYHREVFPIIAGVSHLMVITGYIHQSDRIYIPHIMEAHGSNTSVIFNCMWGSDPMKCHYTGIFSP